MDGYEEIEKLVGYLPGAGKSVQRFVRELLARCREEGDFLVAEVYESLHSVGSDEFRLSRRQVVDTG